MPGRKLDFSMVRRGELDPIKVRLFKGTNGQTYADLDGLLFNGWEATEKEITDLIAILQEVKIELIRGV